MGCQQTKCRVEGCPNHLPACQLINGYCPACWTKLQQK